MHRKFRDWDWCSNLELVDGGKIVVIWNPKLVDCTPLEISSQVIHCNIVDKVTTNTFVCSFVYAFNTVAARGNLWSSLISSGINNYEPWMLLGDFNSTLSIEDRMGGVQIANSDMDEVISCATMLGLEDAYSMGNQFTWSNSHHWAKLDRVLLNNTLASLNYDCQSHFLQFNSLSDHTPITVSLSAHTRSKINLSNS